MRIVLLLGLLLGGCAPLVVVDMAALPRHGIELAFAVAPPGDQPSRGPGAKPTFTSDHDRGVIAEARALTRDAAMAAKRGDCMHVRLVQARVLLLPAVQLEGGVHDVVFLREPAVVECLAATAPKRGA